MKIRPLTKDDIDRLKVDGALKDALVTYIEKHGESLAKVAELDGEIIFACGICPFWPGVAEAWIRVFDDSKSITIIRTVQKLLKNVIEDNHLHRLQATIRADDARTLRFDQFIGFYIDATIPEYYSDRTDALILRFKNGS